VTVGARLPCASLALLALRRVSPRGRRVAGAALTLLWLASGGAGIGATGVLDEQPLRAARRSTAWIVFGCLFVPILFHAAADTGRRWAAGDRDWIGARAVSHACFAASTWLGLWLFGALAAAAVAGLGELAAGGDGPSARRLASLSAPSAILVTADARAAWVLEDGAGALRPGRRLQAELLATPGAGPTAPVAFTCRRRSGGETSRVEGIVSGRTRLELPLPEGGGDVELVLERRGPGCGVAILADSLALFEPVPSERAGSLALLLRVLVWLGAWSAVALGLGAWMRPMAAAALTLALQLPTWSADADGAARLFPGVRLGRALDLVGAGRVPVAPGATELLGLVLLAALGCALAVSGLARGGPR
jgi:hypothetical protein